MLKHVFLLPVNSIIKELRSKEYSTLDKELFIRKPIGNEDLINEIKHIILK